MLQPLLALVLSSFSLYADPFIQAWGWVPYSFSCIHFSPSPRPPPPTYIILPIPTHASVLAQVFPLPRSLPWLPQLMWTTLLSFIMWSITPSALLPILIPHSVLIFLSVLLPHNIVCLSVYFYYFSSLLLECWVSDSKDLALFDAKSLAQSLWNKWLHNFLQDGRIV